MQKRHKKKNYNKGSVRKLMQQAPGPWEDMPDVQNRPDLPDSVTRIFRNLHMTVIVHDDVPHDKGGTLTKVQISMNDNSKMTDQWHRLQGVKNDLFGEQTIAFQVHPTQTDRLKTEKSHWLYIFDSPRDVPWQITPKSKWEGIPIYRGMTESLQTLINAHEGRKCLVLGGGQSLPKDFDRFYTGSEIIISVNHHAFGLKALTDPLIDIDYIVALDDPSKMKNNGVDPMQMMYHRNRIDSRTPKDGVQLWNNGYSHSIALSLACLMCDEVVLCGFDLGKGYYYTKEQSYNWQKQSKEEQLADWHASAPDLPFPDKVTVASGALTKIFPQAKTGNFFKDLRIKIFG